MSSLKEIKGYKIWCQIIQNMVSSSNGERRGRGAGQCGGEGVRIIQSASGLYIPNEMRAVLNNLVNDQQGSFVCVLRGLSL